MKRIISFALIICVLLSFPVNVYAKSTAVTINITAKQMNNNAAKSIESALSTAKKKATSSKPYIINVPSGKYDLKSTLHIYSNTTLHLEKDTQLIKRFEDNNMLKLGVQEDVNTKYSGYSNIVIEGGVWNANYTGNSCIMRFAHCENVVLRNTTLKNQKNAHHMELAAANNFKILNCTFSGYQKTSGGDGEAIQIDPIHTSYHFPAYPKYDDTPCKNVTVKGCTFKNVYAGVGTRSGVIGSYFTNMVISNNTFTNITDKAICAFNYKNSKIDNNTINNASMGIIFEYFPASNLLGKLYMPNSKSSSTKLISKTKCTINGNKIIVKNSNSRLNSSGIAVYGGKISKEYSKKVNLKSGSYTVSGLEIKYNRIKAKSKSSRGILLSHVNSSKILNNAISSSAKAEFSGIVLYTCKNDGFKNNSITSFASGISANEKSIGNVFKKNTIKKNATYAITADKNSKVKIYYGNTIKENKKGKYNINSKNYPLYSGKTNLKAVKKSKYAKLSWNKTKGVSGYVVYRSVKKNGAYKALAVVKAKNGSTYTDKKTKGKKYFYKVVPYKSVNGSKIYAKTSNII